MAAKRWYVPSPEQEAMAAELVELRKARRISQDAAAKAVGLGAPQISEIETATRPIAEDTLLALLRFLKVEPAVATRLNRLRAVDIDKHEWFAGYTWPSDDLKYVMRAEGAAETICASQERAFPALLQTSGYAAELLKNLQVGSVELDEAVDLRVGRQRAFFKPKRHGVRFRTLLSEGLLRKGPRDILGEQLEHLLRMQNDGRIECRIVPENVLLPMLGFTLVDFAFGRSIGYADGGLNELDVVRMRDVARVDEMRSRYSVYSRMALSADESVDLIEKYQKGL